MSPPFNPKFTFSNGAGTTTEQFLTGGLYTPLPPLLPLINNNQGSNDNDNSGSSNGGRNHGDDLDCEDIDERNFLVGNNDPNGFDGDNDGIGCETNDIDNNNGTIANDLNCSDVGGTNIAVGSNDPNNLDGDNDGIGCETNEGDNDHTNNDNNEQQTEQTSDPRNDPKYDSIDWQDDDPSKNLSIEKNGQNTRRTR